MPGSFFGKKKNVEAKPQVATVKLDTGEPFGKTVSSDDELRRWVQKLVESPQRREDSRMWASDLRFLSPLRLLDSDSRDDRINPVANMQLSASDPQTLKKYVAVSYCWRRSDNETYDNLSDTERTTCRIHWLKGRKMATRDAKAPPIVIRRAVKFAQAYYTPNIWIDQECIDQDNRVDKELGIQAMDLVYEGAPWSVGLLMCVIKTRAQMSALEQILSHNVDLLREQNVLDVMEVLNLLTKDPWFTRAWTYQEAIASGADRMYLLIRYNPDLIKKVGLMGNTTEEIEISVLHLSATAGSLLVRIIEWRETGKTTLNRNLNKLYTDLETILSELLEVCPHKLSGPTRMYDGITALHFLERRENNRPADRLAILANLCAFPKRINTFDADEYQMSLSVCAYLLCVMNGDLSLVTCTGNIHPSNRLAYSWGPPKKESLRTLFSKGPKSEAGGMVNFHSPRLVRSILLPEGLHLSGWIWKIGEHLDISDLKVPITTYTNRGSSDRPDDPRYRFIWLFLTYLVKKSRGFIAELCWSSLVFNTEFEFNSTNHTWEDKRNYFDKNILPSPLADALVDTIKKGGRLSLGYRMSDTRRITQSSPDPVKYQAIFFSAIDVGGMVLTPELEGRREHKAPSRRRPFSSVVWEVKDPSASILEGKGQTSGAYWIGEDDQAKLYTLS